MTTEQQARDLLESKGFQVRNLWNIEDVREFHPDKSDEELLALLHKTLTSDYIMQEIWFAIKNHD